MNRNDVVAMVAQGLSYVGDRSFEVLLLTREVMLRADGKIFVITVKEKKPEKP